MKIMVTGGQSMIGRQVVQLLEGQYEVDPVPHSECDLCLQSDVMKRFSKFKPDWVIHLAGYNGGIHWNKTHPETIFRRTAMMAMNVLEACHVFDVKKTLSVISSCAYPDCGEEMKEEDFWNGPPNESVECHGYAKRILGAYSRQLNRDPEVKGQFTCAIINNCYGPWDSFHPWKSKAASAIIRRFVEAKQEGLEKVECWGSGKPRREFVYCKDAARALTYIIESSDVKELINVGTGIDYSIKEFTEKVKELVGYEGDIIWDESKPDGQMRRLLCSDYLRKELSFNPKYNLDTGLKETINWYQNNKEIADERFSL